MPIAPTLDHARLLALQALIERVLARHARLLDELAPAVSGWTARKQIAHVALANELVVRNLKSLAQGSGLLVVRGGEPVPAALAVLESGRLPRGRAQSPRMVRPPDAVDPELLATWLGDARRELELIDAGRLHAGELKIPHQMLGPLDAPQWLRFGVVHTRHHLEIAWEILRALDAEVELEELPPI
jgi:hypothetical protein